MNENTVVMAIFRSPEELRNCIENLRVNGFRNADISALLPSQETGKEFAHVNATKAPEGAATGGTAGAILGGTLGWLAGVGSIAIPGVGPFIAAGPIMAMLAGAAVGTAMGGVAGALIGMGVPEYEAKRYEGMVQEGGYLLSVHCDNGEWLKKAEQILKESGGRDVATVNEADSDSQGGMEQQTPRPLIGKAVGG